MAVTVLMLVSCGKGEFGFINNNDNSLTFTAKNADKDTSVTAGTIEVSDGEKIEITADIKEGTIIVEVYKAAEGTDLKPEGEPILTRNATKAFEAESADFQPGKYLAIATCTEKANGTVKVSVVPSK